MAKQKIEKFVNTTGEPIIVFGLSAIKGVGDKPIYTILEARGDEPFQDFEDFARRCPLNKVGKKALENLIKVGALDEFGYNRAQVMDILPQMMDLSKSLHKAKEVGQNSFFDGMSSDDAGYASISVNPHIKEWNQDTLLGYEKELVGTYLSGHPMNEYNDIVAEIASARLGDDDLLLEQKNIVVVGKIANVKRIKTKRQEDMAFIKIEDRYGSQEVVVFPRTYRDCVTDLVVGNIVGVQGICADEHCGIQIQADRISQDLESFKSVRRHNAIADEVSGIKKPAKGPKAENPPVVKEPPMPPPIQYDEELPPLPNESIQPQSQEKSAFGASPDQTNTINQKADETSTAGQNHSGNVQSIPFDNELPEGEYAFGSKLDFRVSLEVSIPYVEDLEYRGWMAEQITRLIMDYPGRNRFAFEIDGDVYEFPWGCDNTEELQHKIGQKLADLYNDRP